MSNNIETITEHALIAWLWSEIGHDFTLTRNGHGAGFWDRGLGDVGDKLTALCKPFGGVSAYVGDDGKIGRL